MTSLNPFKKAFSASKIGTGRFFTAGKLSGKSRMGLGGALRNAKGAGLKSYAKNLSKEDLAKFQDLIGNEMKDLSLHSEGLSYKARARIMTKAEQMVRNGTISAEDKRDLRNIVEALGPDKPGSTTSSSIEPKERVVNFSGRDSSDQEKILSPEVQNNIRASIKVDVAREMEDEETKTISNRVYSGNALGRQEVPEDPLVEDETMPQRGKKVELPRIDNLPDFDIG